MDATALKLTMKLAACTTLILLAVGLPLAWWLATTTRRWKVLVEAAVALPLVLPPTVVGFYVLMGLGPEGPLADLWARFAERESWPRLPFTFWGILIGSVLFNLPFAVRPFAATFEGVDRRLLEASYCLGVSRLGTFVWVVLPLAWPGILAGVVLTFAHAVGEFGVVLMLGGSIPGVTRTVSVAIYDDVQSLDYAAANASAACLLGFAFAVLCVTYALQRRGPGM